MPAAIVAKALACLAINTMTAKVMAKTRVTCISGEFPVTSCAIITKNINAIIAKEVTKDGFFIDCSFIFLVSCAFSGQPSPFFFFSIISASGFTSCFTLCFTPRLSCKNTVFPRRNAEQNPFLLSFSPRLCLCLNQDPFLCCVITYPGRRSHIFQWNLLLEVFMRSPGFLTKTSVNRF